MDVNREVGRQHMCWVVGRLPRDLDITLAGGGGTRSMGNVLLLLLANATVGGSLMRRSFAVVRGHSAEWNSRSMRVYA